MGPHESTKAWPLTEPIKGPYGADSSTPRPVLSWELKKLSSSVLVFNQSELKAKCMTSPSCEAKITVLQPLRNEKVHVRNEAVAGSCQVHVSIGHWSGHLVATQLVYSLRVPTTQRTGLGLSPAPSKRLNCRSFALQCRTSVGEVGSWDWHSRLNSVKAYKVGKGSLRKRGGGWRRSCFSLRECS